MKHITFALFSIFVTAAGCKSYEDAFNRNLNSTGLYITNSASNTVSMFAADPKSGILNDLGTVSAGTTPLYTSQSILPAPSHTSSTVGAMTFTSMLSIKRPANSPSRAQRARAITRA